MIEKSRPFFVRDTIGRPTKLARSGTPRTHATVYLLYNYPEVGNFIRDFQSNINTYIQTSIKTKKITTNTENKLNTNELVYIY